MEKSERDQERNSSIRRFRALTILIAVAGLVILVKMFIVMFAERQYWHDVADCLVDWNVEIPARRGNILSDEGMLLASSMPQYRIHFDFKSYEKTDKAREKDLYRKDTLYDRWVDQICGVLAEVCPQYTYVQLRNHLSEGHRKRSNYCSLLPDAKPLNYNQYKAIDTCRWMRPRYENWFYQKQEQISRKKPFGTLATRTLGDLYGAKDSARYGLELSFDSLLRGTPGIGHETSMRGYSRLVTDREQIDGCDVHTTINVEIQDIAEQALRREIQKINAVSGTVLVMEVKTGDIKAIASLTRTGDGGYYEIQNNAVKELYEPGSTFKTVSMMVALEDNKFSIEDSVYCEKGSYGGFNAGKPMTDSHPLEWLSVPEVLAQSSNIGTAKLISAAYKGHEDDFVKGIKRIGLDTHFDMQLQGTAAPVIREGGYWDNSRLPWMSFGYGIQLPVINTLAFYNAIANDGCMVEPRLVTEVTRDGDVVMEFPVKTVNRKICSDRTLEKIRYMLGLVVTEGTGKQAASKHFAVAGKTGTAQLAGGKGYRDGGVRYMVSFCGYFPADEPKYTCIASIRTSNNWGAGGTITGPIFHEISEKVMASTSLKDLTLAADTLHTHTPKVMSGDLERARKVLRALGISFDTDRSLLKAAAEKDTVAGLFHHAEGSDWGAATVNGDTLTLTPGIYDESLVPDVVGMGAADAVYLLESRGLKVHIEGCGRVVSQSIKSGAKARKGSNISLKLRM